MKWDTKCTSVGSGKSSQVQTALCILFFRGFVHVTKSYFPLLINFKLNISSLLFNRHRKEYVWERILFNSDLLSSRLQIAMATQRYTVHLKEGWLTFLCHVFNLSVLRHFRIKIYGPIICLYFLKKEQCLTCICRASTGCRLEAALVCSLKVALGIPTPQLLFSEEFPVFCKRNKMYVNGCCQCSFLTASLPNC